MGAIIAGTVLGTLASIVVVHYVRQGLRWYTKRGDKDVR